MIYRFDMTTSRENWRESDMGIPVYIENEILSEIPVDDDILAANLLVAGTTRIGKTTFLINLIKRLRVRYPEALFVIFDPKRDFLPLYEEDNDILCSFYADDGNRYRYFAWNLIKECVQSEHPEDQLRELLSMIFEEDISVSKDPFFPKAAREILIGYCLTFIRRKMRNPQEAIPTNHDILSLLKFMSADQLRTRLAMENDNRRLIEDFLPCINGQSTKQAQGVLACLTEVLTLFVGTFAGQGQDTIHEFLQQSGKTIFLEYDYAREKSSNAFYRIFLKMIIQEKLSQNSDPHKKVFLILDEAAILKHDFDLANALNIGGGLGLRTILACQSTAQFLNLVPEQKEYLVDALMAGFASTITFRLNDAKSLEQIQRHMGQGNYAYCNFPMSRYDKPSISIQKESAVLPEHLTNLNVGEAYVKLKNSSPIKVKFIKEE